MITDIKAEETYEISERAAALERGPLWLRERRKEARKQFNATPVPPRGLHLWRYTDPSKFLVAPDVVDTAFEEGMLRAEKIEKEHFAEGTLAGLAIDYGGRTIECLKSDALNKAGVVLSSLSDAVATHNELIEKHLYGLINNTIGKFESMNGALWNDGIFLYVPDNKTVELPIHLLREAGQGNSASFPRLLVIVGNNAELTLIDEYGGGEEDSKNGYGYSNGAVELFAGQDSRVRYVSLQRHRKATISYLTHRAQIDRGANVVTIPLSFGSILSKQNFGVILNGKGSDSRMYGLLFGTGRQMFDNHTLHHHASGQTYSDIDFKVVLAGKAQSAYTGLIRIDEDSQTCEAYQENRNLLLDSGTKAETIPELEILNEDVSCSHGATVGPIDEMQVFYLNSRGIPKDEAVRMVVSGFVSTTIKLVPENLQERISDVIADRLKDL